MSATGPYAILRAISASALDAGIALAAVTMLAWVVLWARPLSTSGRARGQQLSEILAWGSAIAMAVHLAALTTIGPGGLPAELATLVATGAIPVFATVPRLYDFGTPRDSASAFPNYTQMESGIPIAVWRGLRAASLLGGLAVTALLLLAPATGLVVMWRVVIPCLPALFLIAPGLWRNLCPLAAANQTPRTLRITRASAPPAWLKEYGFVIAFSLFIAFVGLRRLGLDRSGPWSALLLFGAMASAFAGGVLLKGKSGWCSTICPLLPVQRIYGQTPLVMIPNAHCQPCVGCVKNCYDFNPRAAYLADLHDADDYWSGYRRFFVGAFPGLVLSFFVVAPGPPLRVLATMALYQAVSTAAFTLLGTFVKTSAHALTSLFGALAFSVFYWFAGSFGPIELTWLIRITAITLAATWFTRTLLKERAYLKREAAQAPAPAAAAEPQPEGPPSVTFLPDGEPLASAPGISLLELAEANHIPIEAGCRMGVCGADPVAITAGAGCTSPIGEDERATLDRLGLAANARLACCVRVSGPVTVSLEPEAAAPGEGSGLPAFEFDREVGRVVIVGNGIAGVTAADALRRRHPEAEIDLIAAEAHHLYNRMGIARLVYGRSAMEGLYLNPDAWYEDRRIRTWLNTRAVALDREHRTVELGTGERLAFDRLILATGAASRVPQIDGFGIRGTGVLRSATDAIALRAFAQEVRAQRAVVAGGGLLGLEAAYALHKLGLKSLVLERSDRLLRRQLDRRAGQLLQTYLERLGVKVIARAELQSVSGDERLEHFVLRDGRRAGADVLLVAAGIEPDVALARSAGLGIGRGILVDDRMQTDDPAIYAVGDAAEFGGETPGLWAAAVAQAEVAAENAAGGDRAFSPIVPATTLKVAGIDLTSIGQIEAVDEHDHEIVLEDPKAGSYRKLVLDGERLTGAILIGAGSELTGLVRGAVTRGVDVSGQLDALRAGRWLEALC